MMTFEDRARHAAEAVRTATATHEPLTGMADVGRRQARRRAAGVAIAGFAIFAALLAGTWITAPSDGDAVADQPPPPTLVPELLEPVIPTPPVTVPELVAPPVTEIAPEPTVVPSDNGGPVAVGPPLTEPPPVTEPPTTAPPATSPPTTVIAVDTIPPRLAIGYPASDAVFDEKRIRFSGTTEPGAAVTVGKYTAKVDDAGNWSIVLTLFEGGNRAVFRATDAAGNEQTARITVYYEEPPPVTEPSPPDVVFTAFSTYGSCSEDPPYGVYYGTAKAGSKVQISSAYGSGNTFANDDGHWEVKVFFPEAPSEKVFLVTVSDQFDHSKKFEFVSHLVAD